MPSELKLVVGIDLGFTNASIAVAIPRGAETAVIRDAVGKRETIPSCVWKDYGCGEVVVGHQALRRVGTSPSPIRSIKRLIGQTTTVDLGGEQVTPEEIYAIILRELKRRVDEEYAGIGIIDRAIVAVPTYFDVLQTEAIRRAAESACLPGVELVREPVAVASYHCRNASLASGVFMVFDFGGATLDCTVVRATHGRYEVLGCSGDAWLGGDDINVLLAEDLKTRLLAEGYALDLDPPTGLGDKQIDTLKFLTEGVKKALSSSGEFLLRDSGSLKDKDGNAVVIEIMFQRSEVEAIIRPMVERTLRYCTEALESAGVSLEDVDTIILAGGSTHIPLVRECISDRFCCNSS